MMKREFECRAGMAALAALAVASGLARAGEIRVWPTATVSGDSVQLAEIAELRGFDEATTQRLGQIKVYGAPPLGGELLVRADDVRTALTEAEENLSSITLLGSSRCKVSKPIPPRERRERAVQPKPTRKIVKTPRPVQAPQSAAPPLAASTPPAAPRESLEAAIRQYVLASFPQNDAKLEIRFSPAKEVELKMSGTNVKFEVRSRDEKKLGLRSFEVVVHRAGEEDRTIPIIGEVTLVKEVVVARRAINRGETIEGRVLKLEERRFTDVAAIGLTDLAAAIGQQCRSFVRPGEMISADSIEQRPVVVRGQPVTIWMRQGTLAIRTTGKAQQAGALGDRIEVLRDGSRRKKDLIEAIVTGPATVSMGAGDQLALQ